MGSNRECILRITRDIKDVQTGDDLSIAVAFRECDIRKCRTFILGPAGTPYEFGFYEFSVIFNDSYPSQPPDVRCITTNNGRTRFNPNIYAEGKVCLSILGTWRGEKGEDWSSAQGLESVLWSIQSLLNSNPYENEPGFEDYKEDVKESMQYRAKIYHENLRVSVLQRLDQHFQDQDVELLGKDERGFAAAAHAQADQTDGPWDPFVDLCKRRFLWYYDTYLEGIDLAQKIHGKTVGDGEKFVRTDFESEGNQMAGSFEYTKVKKRFEKMLKKVEKDTMAMVREGMEAMVKENPTALLYQNLFKALLRRLSKECNTPLDLELVDGNPFDWRIILFGRPMTNLDGGIFKIRMVIPIDFPERLPRVTVETPIFHYRVSPSNNALCYKAANQCELASHIEGIIKAVEDENTVYDQDTFINPEASRLRWGTPEQKKVYTRKLRRSAQDSVEL